MGQFSEWAYEKYPALEDLDDEDAAALDGRGAYTSGSDETGGRRFVTVGDALRFAEDPGSHGSDHVYEPVVEGWVNLVEAPAPAHVPGEFDRAVLERFMEHEGFPPHDPAAVEEALAVLRGNPAYLDGFEEPPAPDDGTPSL